MNMVRIDDRGEVRHSELDRLACDFRCVRVGATQNPKDRLGDYRGRDSGMFVTAGIMYASMHFAYYSGYASGFLKMQEQRLLDIAIGSGRAPLNKQRNSGYPHKYVSGYLYVILAERDIEQGLPLVAPTTPHYPERPPPDCSLGSWTLRQKLIALAVFIILCIAGFFVLFVML